MAKNAKVGGNSAKKGRMKAWCAAYRGRQQRERNRAPALLAHIRRAPWDAAARAAYAKLPKAFREELPGVAVSPAAQRKADGVTLSAIRRGVA